MVEISKNERKCEYPECREVSQGKNHTLWLFRISTLQIPLNVGKGSIPKKEFNHWNCRVERV